MTFKKKMSETVYFPNGKICLFKKEIPTHSQFVHLILILQKIKIYFLFIQD